MHACMHAYIHVYTYTKDTWVYMFRRTHGPAAPALVLAPEPAPGLVPGPAHALSPGPADCNLGFGLKVLGLGVEFKVEGPFVIGKKR